MPNICYCNLEIKSNDEKILNNFIQYVRAETCVFDFDLILKVPSHLNEMEKFEWKQQNWGTKWNTFVSRIVKRSNNNIHYYFETVWTPPINLLYTLSKFFPELDFYIHYKISESYCMGELFLKNDKLLNEKYFSILEYAVYEYDNYDLKRDDDYDDVEDYDYIFYLLESINKYDNTKNKDILNEKIMHCFNYASKNNKKLLNDLKKSPYLFYYRKNVINSILKIIE